MDTAFRTLSDLLDSGPFERHGLLGDIERGSRENPRPWVAALRRLREARSMDPAVVTYLLHLMTSTYALDLALADGAMANLVEALRIVFTSDHDDDDELADLLWDEEWPRMAAEANMIRAGMSARYHQVEQAVLRGLGETEYADALLDLPRLLEASRLGRTRLLGPSWPLHFVEALLATGDLRLHARYLDDMSPEARRLGPRDALLTILDRSSTVDRRALMRSVSALAERDPRPWLNALNALRAEGRVTADEGFYLATEIALYHLFEIEAGGGEEARLRAQLESLKRLYQFVDVDVEDGNDDTFAPPPADLGILASHLRRRHRRYIDAALRELGEVEVADSFTEPDDDEHYERLRRVENDLFGHVQPPSAWSGPEEDRPRW